MAALTDDQLELLRRARDGLPMWGGSVATERLRRDVELLFALRLIEPASEWPYRITPNALRVLDSSGVQDRVGAHMPSRTQASISARGTT